MEQLTLFRMDDHVSIRIVPQPTYKDDIFGKGWEWVYDKGCSVTCDHPVHSKRMLAESPYREGYFFDERVIEKVRVQYSSGRGWVWVLSLRSFSGEDDLTPFWGLLKPVRAPVKLECQYCGEKTQVGIVQAMTAYHALPDEPDPNPPLMLCRDCAEDYRSYWTERWQEYYSNLL